MCHWQADATVGTEAKKYMERDHKELVLEGPGPREQVSGERRTEDPHTEADTPSIRQRP